MKKRALRKPFCIILLSNEFFTKVSEFHFCIHRNGVFTVLYINVFAYKRRKYIHELSISKSRSVNVDEASKQIRFGRRISQKPAADGISRSVRSEAEQACAG